MSPGWKEIYSRSLMTAGDLYAAQDYAHLEPLLEVMEGQIDHKEARGALLNFKQQIDEDERKQLETLRKWIGSEVNPKSRQRLVGRIDEITVWKCEELLKFHQRLARDHHLIPEGGPWSGAP